MGEKDCKAEFETSGELERMYCPACGFVGPWRPDTDELMSQAVIDAEKHEMGWPLDGPRPSDVLC